MAADQKKDLRGASDMKRIDHLRGGSCLAKMLLAVSLLALQGWTWAAEPESPAKAAERDGSAQPSAPEATAVQPAPDTATPPPRATSAERRKATRDRARIQQARLAMLRANQERPSSAAADGVALTDIMVAMKLDPRSGGPTEAGDRWVTPPTRSSISAQDMIVARAFGISAEGQPVNIRPEWIATDPEMVTVSRAPGNAVQIAVHRAGESKLRVQAAGVSKDLSISATYEGQVMHVQISQ